MGEKMILIAHRGNISGPNPSKENRMDYIYEALNCGFNCEIDVWKDGKDWWLGHDEPKYKTGVSIFNNPKIWCHAKNSEALKGLKELKTHYFWHDGDDYTITSKGYIWCHKDSVVLPNSICLLPENGYKGDIDKCYGICSNYVNYGDCFPEGLKQHYDS